jgi:hypothetical protein
MAQVKVKITNTDPVTGKKMIAFLTGMPFVEYGNPAHVSFLIKFKETDESTDAIPADGTLNAKRAVTQAEYLFPINTRKISSTTKLYLPDDTQDVNAIALKDYFATKVINTYQGVAGGDQSWKFAEGVLKEVITVMQANGELPV